MKRNLILSVWCIAIITLLIAIVTFDNQVKVYKRNLDEKIGVILDSQRISLLDAVANNRSELVVDLIEYIRKEYDFDEIQLIQNEKIIQSGPLKGENRILKFFNINAIKEKTIGNDYNTFNVIIRVNYQGLIFRELVIPFFVQNVSSFVFIVLSLSMIFHLIIKNIKAKILDPLRAIESDGVASRTNIIEVRNIIKEILESKEKDKKIERLSTYSDIVFYIQSIAHDVKGPIKNTINTIESCLKLDNLEIINECLVSLKDEVSEKYAKLIKRLSKIQDLEIKEIEFEEIDVSGIVVSSMKRGAIENKKREIGIKVSIGERAHSILADQALIESVFDNLITNAFESMSPGSFIEVQANVNGGMVDFIIKNTGSSISKYSLGKIFQLGYTKGKKNGTGIGLVSVKNILMQHGSDIECCSGDNDVAFCFSLKISQKIKDRKYHSFPVSSSEIIDEYEFGLTKSRLNLETSERTGPDLNVLLSDFFEKYRRKFRVVVLDDEGFYLDHFKTMTSDFSNVEINLYESSEQVLENIDFKKVDLAIFDIDLGAGIDGIEAIFEIKKNSDDVDTFFCVHSQRDFDPKRNYSGFNLVFPKPMDFRSYCSLLERVLIVKIDSCG